MTTHTMTSSPAGISAPTGLRARLVAGAARLARFPFGVHQLLFRLAIAGVFLRAGLQKAMSWPSTLALFQDEYKVPGLPPELAAMVATSTEIGGSVLLVLGLGTRLATLPFLGMLATIQLFVYPSAWPEHLVWGSILAVLLTRGGGPISLDRLLGLEPEQR